MHNIIRITSLNDYYLELDKRGSHGVYFYRINGYNTQVQQFLENYFKIARSTGVIIDGCIANPTNQNLEYYSEMLGSQFLLDKQFITVSLKKWLPRLSYIQINDISLSIYDTLLQLKKSGKTDGILKNIYIKFMCWFYYKFERILSKLGANIIPKVLYVGTVSIYELLFLQVLSKAGCDIVLVQCNGDNEYLKLDKDSKCSYELILEGLGQFPKDFSVKSLMVNTQVNKAISDSNNTLQIITNTWITKQGYEDILTQPKSRGIDKKAVYNTFIRISGVDDKGYYEYKLYQFYQQLLDENRNVLIVDGVIDDPHITEIQKIRRGNYKSYEELIPDIRKNIIIPGNVELQKIVMKGFTDVLLEESKEPNMTTGKLLNKAVYLLCWFKKYQAQLFNNWSIQNIPCLIYFGNCQNGNVALFVKWLSKLPVDILLLNPNLYNDCIIKDKALKETVYTSSLEITKFPKENVELQVSTYVHNAYRELDSCDEFINSYKTINILNLRTMYEEIPTIWNQSIETRPNYSLVGSCLNIPTLYAKVSGIDNQVKYWNDIKELLNDSTLCVKRVPYVSSSNYNPLKNYGKSFLKNGKLQRDKIVNYVDYQYSILSEDMQEIVLDKIQTLLDQKVIRGTYTNGTEYTVVTTALYLPMDILRMIRKFDVTKTNPKLLFINTTEQQYSLEDAIIVSLLHLLGFDILFYVPTGYPTIERYLTKNTLEEHTIGSYTYGLTIPDFKSNLTMKLLSFKDKLYRRND